MLKTVLNINISDVNANNGQLLNALNTLNSSKQSLNNVMKYVDGKWIHIIK